MVPAERRRSRQTPRRHHRMHRPHPVCVLVVEPPHRHRLSQQCMWGLRRRLEYSQKNGASKQHLRRWCGTCAPRCRNASERWRSGPATGRDATCCSSGWPTAAPTEPALERYGVHASQRTHAGVTIALCAWRTWRPGRGNGQLRWHECQQYLTAFNAANPRTSNVVSWPYRIRFTVTTNVNTLYYVLYL